MVTTTMGGPALRIAAVADGRSLRRWQKAALEAVLGSEDARVVAVVRLPSHPALTAALAPRGFLARRLLARMAAGSAAMRQQPWPALHEGVVRLDVASVPERHGQRIAPDDVARIVAHAPDVVLWLASGRPLGDILSAARHGVWSHDHDGGAGDTVGPTGFRESSTQRTVVTSRLVRIKEPPAPPDVLYRGRFAVDATSYARTRDRVLLGSASWAALVCSDIRRDGGRLVEDTAAHVSPVVTPPPDDRSIARVVMRNLRGRIWNTWRSVARHDHWNVGVVRSPVTALIDRHTQARAEWAPERRGRYAADPFGIAAGDGVEVLFEDYSHRTGTASIAAMTWRPDHGWAAPATALETDAHLSYPCLISDGDRLVMVPESSRAGVVRRYVRDASAAWRPDGVVLSGLSLSDPTLLRHDGRWWLFAVRRDELNPNTFLSVAYADSLDGPWRWHARDPVLVDPRCARPAGALFTRDGALYRPAQDCSEAYGSRVLLRRVTRLTPDEYSEEPAGTVEPDPTGHYRVGLHTLNGVSGVTLIDGRRRTWSTAALARIVGERRRGERR